MDDTPDKVRRNLLVYCSVLLIGWYLGIDARSLVSIPGVEIKALDPLKTSILSLIILLYLAMRFSYTEDYITGADYRPLLKKLPYDSVMKYVQKASDDYKKYGKNAGRSKIFRWNELDKQIYNYEPALEDVKISFDIGTLYAPENDRLGNVGVSCSGRLRGDVSVLVGAGAPRHIAFELPAIVFYRMKLKAGWKMFVNEEKFVTAKLPMIMAVVTYLYILYKILFITVERL